mgnify:CR=1 FL=1
MCDYATMDWYCALPAGHGGPHRSVIYESGCVGEEIRDLRASRLRLAKGIIQGHNTVNGECTVCMLDAEARRIVVEEGE